ncbi:MAG: GGDEF domain-containing protein [Acidobacteriota bacterium]|nr:GGDEF domain-containing protein [Acidobacteriota bacterium]
MPAEFLKTTDDAEGIPKDLRKRLQSCRTLPSVPAVVVQVLDLVQNPDDIGTADLAKVVARDPALVAKILKVANSAWCGITREVKTLEQAVILLGLSGTMSLALSFSLVRSVKPGAGVGFDHQQYWRRAIISAAASVAAGMALKTAHREELFLTGLLQDIGMLVLNEAVPEYGRMAASALNDHMALVEIERRELQADHAQVGAWFLHRWGLPDGLVAAVRGSHGSEKSDCPLNDSTALSSRIADIWINAESVKAVEDAADAADSLFGLGQEGLNRILTQTAEDFPSMVADLDMKVGDEFQIDRLLDQSRDAIAEINVQMIREARGLAAQAQRDSLTSLYNRSYLEQILDNQFTRSASLGQPLTAIFIDVDNFKGINDTYGHAGGDVVLVEIAKTIQSAVRNYDTVVRYGGDEFIALLANAPYGVGADVSERIRTLVADRVYDVGEGTEITATVSIGHATMLSKAEMATPKALLEAADKNLYIAKSNGRNCVA